MRHTLSGVSRYVSPTLMILEINQKRTSGGADTIFLALFMIKFVLLKNSFQL